MKRETSAAASAAKDKDYLWSGKIALDVDSTPDYSASYNRDYRQFSLLRLLINDGSCNVACMGSVDKC